MAKDQRMTRRQLIEELAQLRLRVAELQTADARHKETEDALRESEERYRSLVELSLDVIVVHSEGKIDFINRAGAKFLGAAGPEGLIGKPVAGLVHEDESAGLQSRLRQIEAKGEERSRVEERLVLPDGSVAYIDVSSIPIRYGNRRARQVVVRDVTEYRRAEQALRESEQKYQSIVESSSAGVVSVGVEGRITFVNATSCGLIGCTEEELMGRSFFDFLAPEDTERVGALFASAFTDPKERLDLVTCSSRPTAWPTRWGAFIPNTSRGRLSALPAPGWTRVRTSTWRRSSPGWRTPRSTRSPSS